MVSGTNPDVISDPYNYAAESVVAGNITFTRYVYTEKVAKDPATEQLDPVSWDNPDTGLKRVTVSVVWHEGVEGKQVTLVNLRENPNRPLADGDFNGTVRSTMSVAIPNALVEVLEDTSWRDATNSAGAYDFSVSAGTYTLRSSATGYFDNYYSNAVVSGTAPVTVDFTMTRMSSGTVTGSVWKHDHVVISQVGSELNGDPTDEFIELYNPTTFFVYVVNANVPQLSVRFVDNAGNVTEFNQLGNTTYMAGTQFISPYSYYLFGNHMSVGGSKTADSYWNTASTDIIKQGTGGEGGIVLFDLVSGSTIDRVAWGRSSSPPPSSVEEGGTFVDVSGGPGGGGLNNNETVERIAYASSTLAMMEPSGAGNIHKWFGNSYDSNNTAADWVHHNHNDWSGTLQSLTSVEVGWGATGSPLAGAYVFADDGLSATAQADASGNFTLTSVGTGTWNLYATSGTLYSQQSVTVSANSTQQQVIIATDSSSLGYVTGQVTKMSGAPISGISMGPTGVTTDSFGRYRISTSSGLVNIIANQGGANSNYITDSATVSVTVGQITSGVDFVLSAGGIIRGRVTLDGTNALPGVPVSIFNTATSLEQTNVVSASNGYFQATIPTGTYVACPLSDFGETVTPSSSAVTTVNTGSTVFTTTFTVTSAFGEISGAVTDSTGPITTGVLIVVTTSTITGSPPSVDAGVRLGNNIYYMASSGGGGTYTLPVRAGTYNVYAWYTSFNGSTPTTTKKTRLAVVVAAGATTTGQDFSW